MSAARTQEKELGRYILLSAVWPYIFFWRMQFFSNPNTRTRTGEGRGVYSEIEAPPLTE